MREPASKLADASSFFIPTPMVDALHQCLEEWTQCGHNGGLVVGESRQGKTTAVLALSDRLTNRDNQIIPLFRMHFGRRDVDSVRAVFGKIARSLVSMAIYFDPPLANKIDPPFIVYLVAFCFSR